MKQVNVYRDSGFIGIGEIESFEKLVGYKFPSDYKKLISYHNALRPASDCFDFEFKSKKDSRDVSFYGYGSSVSSSTNIARNQQEKDQYYREHLIVIGESANGDYICFDYRSDPTADNPSVVLMLHDYPDEDNKMLVCSVADNFEMFLDSLYED